MRLGIFRAEYLLADAHRSKLHLVTGERASLIRKDVVKLTEIFNDTHILDFCSLVLCPTEHVMVSSDEPGDEEFDHLGGHEERNRYQCV